MINLAQNTERRAHISDLLAKHNIAYEFSAGAKKPSHEMGCTHAHLAALETLKNLPALVLEDDVSLLSDALLIPEIPTDADIIYLGVSPFGCFPTHARLSNPFARGAHYGLALASVKNNNWLQLHSMAGAIAVLYVSQKGVDTWRNTMRAALKDGVAFDIYTAQAMTSLNVYAPHTPLFYESAKLQRRTVRVTSAQRRSWTTTPLRPIRTGDKIRFPNAGKMLSAQACLNDHDRLEWSLIP